MADAAAPTAPRIEHRTDRGPVLGLGTPAPRLSWRIPAADPDFVQTGYEIDVDGTGYLVESADQILVPWPAPPLTSRERKAVRVRVRGGSWSGWSPATTVEAGLLAESDWSARFVSPVEIGGYGRPAPILRRAFTLPATAASARLHLTAHGVLVASLNGRRVGTEELAPGWTSYRHRLRYRTHDVTTLLEPGDNVIEVLLGNGWYRGRLGWDGRHAHYGDRLALLAQLEVTDTTGATRVIATDRSWTARESGVLADDLYDGQRTDLRIDPGPDTPVEVVPTDLAGLVAADGPPVRVTEVLPAARVWTSPGGATLVDLGQNLVGRVRLRVVDGKPGQEVTVRHAEVLEDGELGVRPLRTAKATDSYLLAGGREEVLDSELTFHGFRYAEVGGVPGLRAEDVSALVVGTDLDRAGWFGCSDPVLERFHENVVWSARGNFLDVPTDCPQRDERLGWTGDLQVFAPTATFLFDCAGFLTSWLADLAADQHPDGSVPFVIPAVSVFGADHDVPHPAAAAWGDAAVLVPWTVYRRTGDAGVLARQLPSMRAWVDRITELAGPDRVWSGGFQFGDWLDPSAPPDRPAAARTHPDLVATAYLARSADVLARAAAVVGDPVADAYAGLAAEVRTAFADTFGTADGRLTSDAQTAYALAVQFGLTPVGDRLAELVEADGFHIGTGFVGTPLVADALTATGHVDAAYRLMRQTECPSWLYPVTMGATTSWERWDSMLPDGRINPGEMTSFNHYALGAVADWLHRTVAGLAPAAPGWRRLTVRPLPGGGLTSASARHRTPYGEAAVAWERADGRLTLRVEVPVGVIATVHVPGADRPETVRHGRHEWQVPY